MPWVAISRSKSVFEVPLSGLQGLRGIHLERRMPWVAVSRSKSVFEVPQSDAWGLRGIHLEPGMPWGPFPVPSHGPMAAAGGEESPTGSSPQPAEPQQPQSPALRLR